MVGFLYFRYQSVRCLAQLARRSAQPAHTFADCQFLESCHSSTSFDKRLPYVQSALPNHAPQLWIRSAEPLRAPADRRDVDRRPPSSPAEKFPEGKPNWTQLEHVATRVSDNLPYFFQRRQAFEFYRADVLFDNHITGVRVEGVRSLFYNVALLRMLGHLRYWDVRMRVFHVTPVLEDGLVHARWRVMGISALRRLVMLVLKPRNYSFEQDSDWIDGYTLYHVDNEGLVYRVVADRVDPDETRATAKKATAKEKLAAKLAGAATTASTGSSIEDASRLTRSRSSF